MVALGRKYDTGIFLSPTKETCFLYLYTCYLDEDYVPRYARNFVLYYQNRQICLSKVHKMTHEVWNKCISSKSQQFCNIVDRVVLPQLHCCKKFDPSMLHLQVQLHLHIGEKCIFASNTLFTSFKSKIKVGFGPNKPYIYKRHPRINSVYNVWHQEVDTAPTG